MMPRDLLPLFAKYRFISTLLIAAQALVIRNTKPGRISYFHNYFISFQIGFMISLMTNNLGGFDSSYYSGLILVIIGVNLLMPWKARNTGINSLAILVMYISINFIFPHSFSISSLINNLFFLSSTSFLSMSINFVRYKLMRKEFDLLIELKKAKDSLWSEIELAKKIQTALLPQKDTLTGYSVSKIMIPAKEVGGDYFDIIETINGSRWIAIGDVSGHGVDSGLIMMMAQTSIMTLIKGNRYIKLTDILNETNNIIREDISRMGSNHYMTIMLLYIEDDKISVTGHHQDILLYHDLEKKVEVVESKGTWLGIADNISKFLEIKTIDIKAGDTILLFTDGVTEGTNKDGEMYGQDRLINSFSQHAAKPVEETLKLILADIKNFQTEQQDDITLIILKKII
jgi:phosphoserine phosphatase RsbU/P